MVKIKTIKKIDNIGKDIGVDSVDSIGRIFLRKKKAPYSHSKKEDNENVDCLEYMNSDIGNQLNDSSGLRERMGDD